MKLMVVTAEYFWAEEPEAVNRLFGEGMEVLHLRKPHASLDEMKRFLRRIDAGFHPRIVVHDHYELTGLFALRGIHLNRRNDARAFRGRPDLSVSRSCHSFEEVGDAPAEYAYLFLSPVFDSISKAGYKRRYTPEELDDARARGIIGSRVIALGGITAERIPAVRRYGFGGVAVSGALWTADGEIRSGRFRDLRRQCGSGEETT